MKKIDRREFIAAGAAFAGAAAIGGCATGRKAAFTAPQGDIRAFLLHLGHNMWCDWPSEAMGAEKGIAFLTEKRRPDLKLRSRDDYWRVVTDYLAARGINLLVIDLGEGLAYPSHPELAIEGTWSVDKMRAEIARLQDMGIEVIPKLNFSTTHNGWMKDYRHMVSSRPYFRFCEDVIRDVAEIFDYPRFLHIGYDEETVEHQGAQWCGCQHIDVRRGEFWWGDFLHIVGFIDGLGIRPWTWSDYGWDHPEYVTRCPKCVVQSNWYYDESHGGFDPATNKTSDLKRLNHFWALEKAGFDQIPCGTNWVGWKRRQEKVGADDVIGKLVKLGREVIAKPRLLGFMMAPWASCDTEAHRDFNIRGADLFAEALRA